MAEMDVGFEKAQLIATWKATFRSGWLTNPKADARHLIGPVVNGFNMNFRQVHNVFGWKAGDDLAKRGLCSGAIYRTRHFMELGQGERNGSAGPRKTLRHLKTIHIEHTVPASVLDANWRLHRLTSIPDQADAYAWLLLHSVSTAVSGKEEYHLGKYQSYTNALDRSSPDFGLPFMRYVSAGCEFEIWNVLTGKLIDPRTWTFADHLASVNELFDQAGCDPQEARLVRSKAAAMLSWFGPIEPQLKVA